MLGDRAFSFLLIPGYAAVSADAHHSSLQVSIAAGLWKNGATFPRSSSTSPPTEAATNEEPNKAERIGGLPPER